MLILVITILLSTASSQNTTEANTETKVKYLLREEKAAIFAAFIGLVVAVVGFGIYFYEMYVRQYRDRYQYMNRVGSQKDRSDQSVSDWAR